MGTPATAPVLNPVEHGSIAPNGHPDASVIPDALPVATEEANLGRASIRWRLQLGLALTVVIVGMGAIDAAVPGAPIGAAFGRTGLLAAQALLCMPVVFVCGWPILTRAWRTIRNRRLDVYSLVGLGIIAAFTLSLAALLYEALGLTVLPNPDTATSELRSGVQAIAPSAGGTIEPFFEGAAVMVVLMLFGLALEHRARSRTGEAIDKLLRLCARDRSRPTDGRHRGRSAPRGGPSGRSAPRSPR